MLPCRTPAVLSGVAGTSRVAVLVWREREGVPMRSRCALLLLRRPRVVATEGVEGRWRPAGERAASPGVSPMLWVRDTAEGAPAATEEAARRFQSSHELCP